MSVLHSRNSIDLNAAIPELVLTPKHTRCLDYSYWRHPRNHSKARVALRREKKKINKFMAENLWRKNFNFNKNNFHDIKKNGQQLSPALVVFDHQSKK